MTSSYIFLTPPGGTSATADETRTIRDGFTFLGLLFPWIWLLAHRLWLHAAAAFLLQAIGGALTDEPGLWAAGVAIMLGVNMIVGLEGQNWRIRTLAAKGWNEDALIAADKLDIAEQIYFSDRAATADHDDTVTPDWQNKAGANSPRGQATSLGLFGFDGGR
ncbi:DUF2628 domain-containing protein [Rhizobium lentis]|uniref:DUF2628 domain-containing protein n=1 Tax=Rhizobium lentis TaxID=1138194 RepID=A0A9Q3QX04_9HYPH|nr:DUF2628 domain-containing protein [Rhizobium lentis]MBX4958472.1 DUF2628 domain-containing protein [Rhizobium lentis]MBX4976651.1 DUF2628 domain-containing protein [Rhizobium lentis]MBX4988478.1 DUF2628 domain-containing protein [Rhizobium lentis]MBX5006927.1 DUF2628 domain-containing protein [Rhizobium lentis]MBX5013318.1 DUF2628 domain-containing protein [Rhizobium lentis]